MLEDYLRTEEAIRRFERIEKEADRRNIEAAQQQICKALLVLQGGELGKGTGIGPEEIDAAKFLISAAIFMLAEEIKRKNDETEGDADG